MHCCCFCIEDIYGRKKLDQQLRYFIVACIDRLGNDRKVLIKIIAYFIKSVKY